MPIVICPKCSSRLKLPEEVTDAARCPKCQAVITLKREQEEKPARKPRYDPDEPKEEEETPRPSAKRQSDPQPLPTRRARRQDDYEDDFDDDDYDRPRRRSKGERRRRARSMVAGPAIILIILSMICLSLVAIGMIWDLFLLLTGGVMAAAGGNIGLAPEIKLLVRFIWGAVMLVSNILIAVGGFKMSKLEGFGSARSACILSVIPVLGPCCIFGIPFGIWGLIVLADPDVRRAFRN